MGIIGVIFLSLGLIDILDIGPEIFRSFGLQHPPLFLFPRRLFDQSFGIAVLFGILTFRNTKRGYRYRTIFVGSLITLTILTATLLAHFTKIDERIDRAFENRTPEMFRGILLQEHLDGHLPQDGALAGKITDVQSDSFLLQTPNTEAWTIQVNGNTRISPRARIQSGEDVLVLGTPGKNNTIQALFIRPLRENLNDRQEPNANSFPNESYKGMRGAHDRYNR